MNGLKINSKFWYCYLNVFYTYYFIRTKDFIKHLILKFNLETL